MSGVLTRHYKVVVNLQTDTQIDPFVRNVPVTLVLHQWGENTLLPTDYTNASGGVDFEFDADQFAQIEIRVSARSVVPQSPIQQLYNVFYKHRKATHASSHNILRDEPGRYRISDPLQTWTV
jgi:hypothetical protein